MPESNSAPRARAHQGRARKAAARSAWALALVLVLVAPAAWAEACEKGPETITVRVDNVRSAHGNVAAVLYGDNPEDFLKKGRKLERVRAPAQEGLVEICLSARKAGSYAVAVYHDENGNEHFDKSWLGIPVEGYGISNNPSTFFGPPDYEEAAFHAGEGPQVVEIKLNYRMWASGPAHSQNAPPRSKPRR